MLPRAERKPSGMLQNGAGKSDALLDSNLAAPIDHSFSVAGEVCYGNGLMTSLGGNVANRNCALAHPTDQRGVLRPIGFSCDSGAVEAP